MKITEIRIHLMNEDRLKAFASVIFDNEFVVRNMKVVEGTNGIFLCMPSRKMPDGSHKDMVHPINHSFREYLESHVLEAYRKEIGQPINAAHSPSSDYNTTSARPS